MNPRTLLSILAASFLLIAGPGLAQAGPQGPIPQNLDEMIAAALRANPEVVLAEAKLRQAQAESQPGEAAGDARRRHGLCRAEAARGPARRGITAPAADAGRAETRHLEQRGRREGEGRGRPGRGGLRAKRRGAALSDRNRHPDERGSVPREKRPRAREPQGRGAAGKDPGESGPASREAGHRTLRERRTSPIS